MVRRWRPTILQLWTSVQMLAKEHMERDACEFFNGEQQIPGRQMFAGLPVSPSGGGYSESIGGKGDAQVFPQAPVSEPHAKRDAGGVTMIVITGVHRRGKGAGRNEQQP